MPDSDGQLAPPLDSRASTRRWVCSATGARPIGMTQADLGAGDQLELLGGAKLIGEIEVLVDDDASSCREH